MRLKLVSLIFAAAGIATELTTGTRLPELKGQFLTGKTAVLPEAASGRVALLAFGFTYDSRFAVEAWVKRFRGSYGQNPRVTFYEIPVIGGMAQLGKWFIDSGMRRGTPEADREHVITVYGGAGPWKERLGFKAPNAAYLVLVDRTGIIRWRYSCVFDEGAYKLLDAAVEGLLARAE